MDLEVLLKTLKPSTTNAERDLIRRAYHYAEDAHAGQVRKSGDPYFIHCFQVAMLLAEFELDPAVVAAGLLHDTVEDIDDITIEDIESTFGPEIASLVDGVTKMEQTEKDKNAQDNEAEFVRRILLAMNDDVRVILIKLADRLHNMRTLSHLSKRSQLRNANETMDIFAPLANRLGIWKWKAELEDLSFRYIEPEKYREIQSALDDRRSDREDSLERAMQQLKAELKSHHIEAEVNGRDKHIYSIYRKMERKNVPLEKIYDRRAVRVIVPDSNETACYQVLGIVHNLWRAIPGEFDDYISSPKDNGYQSIHTAVIDGAGKTLEVQVRTREMHEKAEYGVASHWRYKEGRSYNGSLDRWVRKLRLMVEETLDSEDASEFVSNVADKVAEDRVYVFTPKGDIFDLPVDSTPIDFAYYVHTEVGHRCRGAKVNGKIVPLTYKLKNNDRVEIFTTSRGGPSLDWMNHGYIKTKRARSKVRQWFRKRDREKNIAAGLEVVEHELKKLNEEETPIEDIAAQLKYESPERLYEAIGYGDVSGQQFIQAVLNLKKEDLVPNTRAFTGPIQRGGLYIGEGNTSSANMLVQLATCCSPVRGDDIIGFITRGRGVMVHRADCKNITNINERERLINVNWGEAEMTYPVPIVIVALNRTGLMKDVATVIADENVNISNVDTRTRNDMATFNLTLMIRDSGQLATLLTKLEQLPEVMDVQRIGNGGRATAAD